MEHIGKFALVITTNRPKKKMDLKNKNTYWDLEKRAPQRWV